MTGDLPEKIYVQLQRRSDTDTDTDTWVSADGNANTYTELATQYVHRKMADFLYRTG